MYFFVRLLHFQDKEAIIHPLRQRNDDMLAHVLKMQPEAQFLQNISLEVKVGSSLSQTSCTKMNKHHLRQVS